MKELEKILIKKLKTEESLIKQYTLLLSVINNIDEDETRIKLADQISKVPNHFVLREAFKELKKQEKNL